jgi:hypothetical protein
VGLWCITGAWGMSRGGLGAVGGCSSRCWRWWGQQESFVEQTMCFDEHSCSTSHESVSSAVDSSCTSVTASLTVSGVSVAVWVLDMALDAISEVAVAHRINIGGCVMAFVRVAQAAKRGAGGSSGVLWVGLAVCSVIFMVCGELGGV